MSTTVGQAILRRYFELEKTCESKIGTFPLPKTGVVDSEDIVMFILKSFHGQSDYLPILRQYAVLTGFDTQLLDKIYPDVKEFLDWTLGVLRDTQI